MRPKGDHVRPKGDHVNRVYKSVHRKIELNLL